MIKNVLLLLVATVLVSGCATLNEKPDPYVGQWKFQFIDLPQGDPDGVLTINKEAGVYSGTVANSNGEYELNDVLIEADNSLTASFQFQGSTVAYSTVFDGTVMSGQASLRNRTFNFTGEKME